MNRPRNPWMRVAIRQSYPRMRLICFPHAGGSASFFRGWSAVTPQEIEVAAIQYPGREDRIDEPFVEDMPSLAAAVSKAIVAASTIPSAFFGHSMGAIVAYEVARHLLENYDRKIVHLFVSAQPPPHLHQRACMTHLDDDHWLLAEMKRLGMPIDTLTCNAELRSITFPAVRNDYRLIEERYEPAVEAKPSVNCPITGIVATSDSEATPEQMSEWRNYTSNGFDLLQFGGDHFYLSQHRVALVLDVVKRLQVDSERAKPWLSTP